MTSQTAHLDELSDEQCWLALRTAVVGRLAVRSGEGVDVFPVNFTAFENAIYLRSAPGSKLVAITDSPSVAFEVDGSHGSERYWSVVLRGTAERLANDSEITASGVLDLPTSTPTAKWNFVRITPTAISGRRFTSARRGRS